ncbi:hypothetical protein RHGRI_004387 [Rhododendron griersonianum]|uniref:arogenate dehydratase n=1 Tax=Rhododendron griersonianum TaxID=479676 RepID=A0AAV6LB46_9ERIC|nr:hypothetical protein RHGRI_004387 [Rhododendron griersonianum]
MDLKAIPIWVCANQPCTQLGFRYLGSRRCGSGGFLKLDGENLRKWGCCGALLAQRATKPVEDEKPVDSPGENNQTPVAQFSGFHRDLNSLPKALSATDLSSSPSDGSKVRVAYQGVPGAYSEVAALKVYPRFELWLVDKAVLPIENSVGGSIHRNYDLLLRHRLNIVGEVQMVVNHCLLGLRGVRKEELKRVLSHPQALDQCEMSLHKLGVVKVNADDTAGAAQIVAADGLRDTGAVASARAAEIYGLDILAERIQARWVTGKLSYGSCAGHGCKAADISSFVNTAGCSSNQFCFANMNSRFDYQCIEQDDSDNVTRFLILAREPIIPGTDKPYKTSIVFTLEEGPGVLFKALAVFALRDINLSKIESRPQRKRPLRVVDDSNKGSARYFDYLFYIDFEASMAEPRAQYALGHLLEFARFLRVLGCYPMDTTL